MAHHQIKETKPFACSYAHDGAEWGLTIHAYDFADAEARIKKLGFLRLNGEVKLVVPHKLGWVAKLVCWLRNLIGA
jgi:hypothetical protein